MKRIVQPNRKKKKILVVGNGMAGFKFCEKFLKYRLFNEYELIAIGEEQSAAYNRIRLSECINQETDLLLASRDWYSQNRIDLRLHTLVRKIDLTSLTAELSDGEKVGFDVLILATGSKPFIPPVEGADIPGVHVYRTRDDLRNIKEQLRNVSDAVVIGGGILGLEAAKAISDFGKKPLVIEVADRLMSRQLDSDASAILQKRIETLGVRVQLRKNLSRILPQSNGLRIILSDGTMIDTDIVVFAAGIVPRDELAKEMGLQVHPKGGIVVNNYLLSSHPAVYAIGECASVHGKIWGPASPAFEMADIVAARLGGIHKVFRGELLFSKLKVMGCDVGFISSESVLQPDVCEVKFVDEKTLVYRKVVVSLREKRLLGAVMVGDLQHYSHYLQMVRTHKRVPEDLQSLLSPPNDGKPSGIEAWPETSIVCLCESVAKSTIVSAIQTEACTTIAKLRTTTGAAGGCESCTQVLEEFISLYGSRLQTTTTAE
jgi:nitrite reductase (NADH) large subunit